jgi:coenzyme F420-reducing hydrogenase alpha subunit
MHKFDIDIKNLSKIEGHTHLSMKVRKGKVINCKLKVSENNRFYKTAVEGVDYKLVANKMSRICGTCSAAHAICSMEAIEDAYSIIPSEQTILLRRLLMNGSHLRDHAMHLFFFCLPDVFGKESIFEFGDKYHDWIHHGLDVKDAGSYLTTIIGGRAVHPPYPVVGGFTNFATTKEMNECIKKLNDSREKILKVIEIFYKDKYSFKRKTNYVGMINSDYNYVCGNIKTAKGTIILPKDYADHFKKVIIPYSHALGVQWESEDFMVGALARMNVNKKSLHKNTKKDCKKYLKVFPSDCIFDNNLAQAIECLQACDISIDLLRKLKKTIKVEKPKEAKLRNAEGIGVVEAPRGTLYYHFFMGADGKVKEAKLCIPTEQNIIHLEKDLTKYVEDLLGEGRSKEEISLEVEKMIRAYDPCMSCATHFLKINWD